MNKKITALIVAAATAVSLASCSSMNQRTETCTVSGKESVTLPNDQGNQYRVHSYECGTLTVADTLTQGRFNSAELYGQLTVETTYDMELGGYRNGLMSMFPNILTATPTK